MATARLLGPLTSKARSTLLAFRRGHHVDVPLNDDRRRMLAPATAWPTNHHVACRITLGHQPMLVCKLFQKCLHPASPRKRCSSPLLRLDAHVLVGLCAAMLTSAHALKGAVFPQVCRSISRVLRVQGLAQRVRSSHWTCLQQLCCRQLANVA